MTGQPDDTAREPTGGTTRIWQLYADEIGLPDAHGTAGTVPTPQPASATSSAPPPRPRRQRWVHLVAATVGVLIVAVVFVIRLDPQRRMLLYSREQRAPSPDRRPVTRADSDLIPAAVTELRSDGRPTELLSVNAPGAVTNRGRVDQSPHAEGSPRTGAPGAIVRPDAGAAPASKTPAAEREPRGILPHRIIFDFDSDVLTGESRRTLDKVAISMKANPDWQLMIAGHTDTHGPSAYNMALSERRAQVAKAYLESFGISPHRLRATGYAASRPLASNDDPLTFLNRRVEFHRL